VKQFEEFIISTFGLETHKQLCQFAKVTPELKSQFNSILPSEREVKHFLIDFCNRSGISLETMNEIGHKLSVAELEDSLPGENQPISKDNNNSQGNNQGGQFGGQGSFPGNFPQGNYPQPGFPQGNYPPNNYQPGPYNGYPQPGYPNYNTNNYQPQQNFQPGGYPPFNGNPQSSYPGGPGGNYQQSSYPSNSQGNQGGSQQPFGSNQQGSQNNYQPSFPSQNPSGNVGSQGGKPNVDFSAKNGDQDLGGYPTFMKFNETVPDGKPKADPLDELDMRLKNIKNGL